MSEILQADKQQAPASQPQLKAAASPATQLSTARQVALKAVAFRMADSVGASGGGKAGAQMGATHEAESTAPADIAREGFQGAARELPFRAEMEKSFGVSFADVRVYTDAHAQNATHKLGAHAYTVGNQIAFASASPDKALIAHELTHVLQQTGKGPAKKSDGGNGGDGGIDTSGEAEAEHVEAAVASGKSATSALGGAEAGHDHAGGATAHGPARKETGAKPARSSKFGMGMTFSTAGLEKSYEYTLWEQHPPIEIPIPAVPGLNFMVEPSVKVKLTGAVNWKEKNISCGLGVEGNVGVGFSYGNSAVASLYGVMEAKASGGFEYKKSDADWEFAGGIGLSTNFRVGCKLAGVLDYGFEFGKCEIGKVTGVSWKNGHFEKDKIGWEWGEKPKEFFTAIKAGIEKAKKLLSMAADAAKRVKDGAVNTAVGAYNTGAAAVHWVSSWF